MGLFSSRFAKLEAFATAKNDERTPDMLKTAQAELDAAGAKLILVPHSEGITTGEQLDKHIENLKTEAETAKAETKKVQDEMAALKGKRMLDSDRSTSDAGTEGDAQGTKTPEQKEMEAAQAEVQDMPHYQRMRSLLGKEA